MHSQHASKWQPKYSGIGLQISSVPVLEGDSTGISLNYFLACTLGSSLVVSRLCPCFMQRGMFIALRLLQYDLCGHCGGQCALSAYGEHVLCYCVILYNTTQHMNDKFSA